MILAMLYKVMRGDLWPPARRTNWGDLSVSVCDWAGLSCDENGELESISFPLAGLMEES